MIFNSITKMDKKDEEFAGTSLLKSIDRVSVLQEAKMFHDSNLSTRKCTYVLSKLLLLLNQGEELTTKEATDVFFAITKLIQCKDYMLRCIVYICIKELSSIANDVIIMTSSIIQDMTSKDGSFRSQAIRALWKITDSSMLPSVERYMKQAIVSRSAPVASAALVSALQLTLTGSADVVKRWSNEIVEAANHENLLTQYHGLAALCTIKQGDRLALVKLITNFWKGNSRSPYAQAYMVQVIVDILKDDIASGVDRVFDGPLFGYVEDCLHHRQEMVVLQAASGISCLANVPRNKITRAVSALQLMLSSQKSLCRFAAVRVLNKLAELHPDAVAVCNPDLECFLRSSNHNLCTLAITTLLKTSDEVSVERLTQQITPFMSEITDEYKIAVVNAIRCLCMKYPQIHNSLIDFLAMMLGEDGGVDFQDAVVEAISAVMNLSPSARKSGLAKLCDFIEDCEHVSLTTKILHLLGNEGSTTGICSEHIRYIYNRIVLEAPAVRAAAVTALARIAVGDMNVLDRVLVLLKQSMLDEDDEVRDRAAFYHAVLQEIFDEEPDEGDDLITFIKTSPGNLSLVDLERLVDERISRPDVTLDLEMVLSPSTQSKDMTDGELFEEKPRIDVEMKLQSASRLATIQDSRGLGPLFKSSEPIALTEPEVEYSVCCIKHVFTRHVVFEFQIENTLDDVVLEDVYVDVKPDEEEICVDGVIPADKVACHLSNSAYSIIKLPEDISKGIGSISSTMRFNLKDVDPNTGKIDDPGPGYPDQLNLEDLDVLLSDHIVESRCPDWQYEWDKQIESGLEVADSFVLPYSTIEEAVEAVTKFLGLNVRHISNQSSKSPSTYTLKVSGVFRGDLPFLANARFALASAHSSSKTSVHMHLSVVSGREDLSRLVLSSIC